MADVSPGIEVVPAPASAWALLAALYAESFETAWDEAAFESLGQTGALSFLAVAGEVPAGMIVVRAVLDEAEILTVATRPQMRGRKVGAILLDHALKQLAAVGAASVHLEVAVDNAAALALYRRSGFEQVGRRRGYYDRGDATVDALVLRRTLNTPAH